MKTISWGAIGAALLFVVLSTASRADGSGNGNSNSVRWETIIGIIQAGNIVGGTTTGIRRGRRALVDARLRPCLCRSGQRRS